MTQDEIIEMVNQVGCVSYSPPPLRAVAGASMTFAQLDALIKLAATKEREACVKAYEAEANTWKAWPQAGIAKRKGVAAIRARGEA